MKKYFFILLPMFFLLVSTMDAETYPCYCYRKVLAGDGCYHWSESVQACPDAGFTCEKTNCSQPILGEIEPYENGYLIHLTLTTTEYRILISYNWEKFDRTGCNYTFESNDWLRIDECAEYPFLEDIEVNIIMPQM